ncbi:PadR family transcriptional regulator [Pseudonocardia sp. GCM10023141]|uniref:PadR family transcriptional regulator n=1 Tax=Pseudonocardia sp. GCM10023141 TaxID=3252653 RepID=UPI00361F8892
MSTTFRRSPLALTILGVLETGPLHPYGIQQLIKQWGKDQVVNVGQRATLYKMITRLVEAGLIAVQGTGRDQLYPERTTYEITDSGRAASRQWLDEILSTPRNEYPEFPAALSFLALVTPQTTRTLLQARRERLAQRVAELDAAIVTETEAYGLPRVTMLESEYVRAVTDAELRWVDAIVEGLGDGTLAWSDATFEAIPRLPS